MSSYHRTLAIASTLSVLSTRIGSASGAVSEGICRATCTTDATTSKETCTFTTKVDVHAGELGYYTFEECDGIVNPTLGMEMGKTYRFVQADRSNYYHPLGFAYYADGAHAGVDELEPGIKPSNSSSTCEADMSCPAPMYFLNDEYYGTYSNNVDLAAKSAGEENFGLDDYEPLFFHPLGKWVGYGQFDVYLKFDADTDFMEDIFYFCHIHERMTGRIKLLKNDVPIQPDAELPALGYAYDETVGHDEKCGTHGLNEFQLPHGECIDHFVCDADSVDEGLKEFSTCIDSMNCAMMAGMTSSLGGKEDKIALFIHQMIPHHQNAVNMGKALMKTGAITCDDLTDEESAQAPHCALEVILREMINKQNHQIQGMHGLLEAMEHPPTNDCTVEVAKIAF